MQNQNYQEKPIYECVKPSDGTWKNQHKNSRVTPPIFDALAQSSPSETDSQKPKKFLTVPLAEQMDRFLADGKSIDPRVDLQNSPGYQGAHPRSSSSEARAPDYQLMVDAWKVNF